MNKIYVVKYCGGDYDEYQSVVIFATTNKRIAVQYTNKFNHILKKWKDYYKQFEGNDMGFVWIKDEHVEQHFYRWNRLRYITKCYYEEIEVR